MVACTSEGDIFDENRISLWNDRPDLECKAVVLGLDISVLDVIELCAKNWFEGIGKKPESVKYLLRKYKDLNSILSTHVT